MFGKDYLKELKKRGRHSRVYQKHQFIGLQIAQILGDEKHKALYIKLARDKNGQGLLELAKSISLNKNVKNRGAYFMTLIKKVVVIPKPGPKKKWKIKSGR